MAVFSEFSPTRVLAAKTPSLKNVGSITHPDDFDRKSPIVDFTGRFTRYQAGTVSFISE